MFLNHWQVMIQYPGSARDFSKYLMGETVAESGGVRFFKKFEKIQHVDTHFPSALPKNVVKSFARKKWSETSSNHLLTEFDGDDQKS